MNGLTLKECVGLLVSMFVAFIVYAFVKAAALTVRDTKASSYDGDGTVFLREDAVDVDALERRTNGKARVTVERER